jgi:hypothetical protein
MRLYELFEDSATPAEIKKIEQALNQALYSPRDEMMKGNPVVDLHLPIEKGGGQPTHFFQRTWERDIPAVDMLRALKKAHRDIEKDKDYLAHEEDAEGTEIDTFDPDSKILIPFIVKPNPSCKTHPEEKPICPTNTGPMPKHQLVPKTIIQKGVPNKREWPAGKTVKNVVR